MNRQRVREVHSDIQAMGWNFAGSKPLPALADLSMRKLDRSFGVFNCQKEVGKIAVLGPMFFERDGRIE